MTTKVAILQLTQWEVTALIEAFLYASELNLTYEESVLYEKLETALEDLETE